jgi:hypothetical protein
LAWLATVLCASALVASVSLVQQMSKFVAGVSRYFQQIPNRVKAEQHALQSRHGPSFSLKSSDKLVVSGMYIGVIVGVALALGGQLSLWTGTNKIEKN